MFAQKAQPRRKVLPPRSGVLPNYPRARGLVHPPRIRTFSSGLAHPLRVRGFTLLEVVITLSVLSLLMLTAWGAFEAGFRTRDKGEALERELAQVRLATEVMGRQLRSAVYYFARDEEEYSPFFLGSTGEISFVTAYPQGQAGNGLAWVTYRVEDGKLIMFERVGFRPDELYAVDESESPVLSSILLDGFTRFSFMYAPREEEGEEWEEVWDAREEDSLPALVKITAEGVPFFKEQTWVEEIPLLTMASGWGMDEFEEPPEVPEAEEQSDSNTAGRSVEQFDDDPELDDE